jgi:hypothetical protein
MADHADNKSPLSTKPSAASSISGSFHFRSGVSAARNLDASRQVSREMRASGIIVKESHVPKPSSGSSAQPAPKRRRLDEPTSRVDRVVSASQPSDHAQPPKDAPRPRVMRAPPQSSPNGLSPRVVIESRSRNGDIYSRKGSLDKQSFRAESVRSLSRHTSEETSGPASRFTAHLEGILNTPSRRSASRETNGQTRDSGGERKSRLSFQSNQSPSELVDPDQANGLTPKALSASAYKANGVRPGPLVDRQRDSPLATTPKTPTRITAIFPPKRPSIKPLDCVSTSTIDVMSDAASSAMADAVRLQKSLAAQQPTKATIEADFDSLIYGGQNASAPPPGVTVTHRPKPVQKTYYGHVEPRILWNWQRSKEWHEAKQAEIKARGGRKANFGNAAARMAARRRAQGKVRFEDTLPSFIAEKSAWVEFLKRLRQVEDERPPVAAPTPRAAPASASAREKVVKRPEKVRQHGQGHAGSGRAVSKAQQKRRMISDTFGGRFMGL